MTMTMPQTANMTLRRTFPGILPHTKLQEISIRGDGNCGYNALSLALLLAIANNELVLNNDQFAGLWPYIANSINLLKSRHESYCLDNFIKFVEGQKTVPTFDAFKAFVQQEQKTRAGLYGLHLGLAPALRSLECALYENYVGNNPSLSTSNKLAFEARKSDTVWVSEEELFRVSTYLGFKINACRVTGDGKISKYGTNEVDLRHVKTNPMPANLVNVGAHWNLLVCPDDALIKNMAVSGVIPDANVQIPATAAGKTQALPSAAPVAQSSYPLTSADRKELAEEQQKGEWQRTKIQDASKLLDDWSAKGANPQAFNDVFDSFVAAIRKNDNDAFDRAKTVVEQNLTAQQTTATAPQMKI